ncbi:hypothetical protein [Streptomyces sp. ALI-76-A]|jgi:putative exporter of polyketide antibiotics|uniref:hypothetical protein n=1 Tax=Streptomyces sp. ALI-76-A TaxID=3025736 RepID=UPI00256EEC33|nr:hypothetical protein [Streptomyces sp. ALI-76-A]MDL5205921.1 hypothetical protein [Streptomyces sp. ALI-76-A]
MAPKNDHPKLLRAVRQMRRIRTFYALGVLLWGATAAWGGWRDPGSRQVWVSVLLLVVFTALLSATSLWLRRHRSDGAGQVAHHAAPRRTAVRRHASA